MGKLLYNFKIYQKFNDLKTAKSQCSIDILEVIFAFAKSYSVRIFPWLVFGSCECSF